MWGQPEGTVAALQKRSAVADLIVFASLPSLDPAIEFADIHPKYGHQAICRSVFWISKSIVLSRRTHPAIRSAVVSRLFLLEGSSGPIVSNETEPGFCDTDLATSESN